MHLDSHILPALGDRSVSSLKRRDCRDLVATCRAKGLARSSVRGMIRTLSTMLSQAVEDELLDANPALRMGRYLRAGDEAEHSIDPLTRAEAATLLSAARDRYPRLFPLLLCALRSGLRQGELLGLRWADTDFAGGSEPRARHYDHAEEPSGRKVDMSAQLCLELEALRRRVRERCLADGAEMPAIVFASDSGQYLDAVDRLDDETQPDATPRNLMAFQKGRNGRKLLVGRPGIEPGTP